MPQIVLIAELLFLSLKIDHTIPDVPTEDTTLMNIDIEEMVSVSYLQGLSLFSLD
jgi:hypothetical protein